MSQTLPDIFCVLVGFILCLIAYHTGRNNKSPLPPLKLPGRSDPSPAQPAAQNNHTEAGTPRRM